MTQLQQTETATQQRTGTLMIVDDEMMVTSSLQTMLGLETRHRIHCFNNPLEALAEVPKLRPDVVISDFSMPGMDGISLLKQIKALLPEATLILLTGYADKESAIEAINTVGLYRYIEKPWDNEDLKISIQNGLERSYLVSDLQHTVADLTQARRELEQTNKQLESLVEERTRDLQATYQKLHSIVNHTTDGILTTDAALNITSMNPAARHWVQQVPELADLDVLNLSISRILKAVNTQGKPQKLSSLFLKQSHPQETSQSLSNGTMQEVSIGNLPLEASIAPLENPDYPEAEGFVVVLRDIAQRKEIERLRDDFVSTLTHDLRTPLLAAIQTLGFFADGTLGELSPRQHELIQMLIQSNRELLGMVNVLLEVYKYESGRQKLIWDTVCLPELLTHIGQELEALAQSREQTLRIQAPPDSQTLLIRGDKQELKRVFVNLMGNAIHFTPKGGEIQVSLAVESTERHPWLQICVADNGRGIPAQDIPLLFQRFSQGTSKQRSSGSGLGLYLSRQIVEAHQGQIWVESTEGKGSRFYVKLPLSAKATR